MSNDFIYVKAVDPTRVGAWERNDRHPQGEIFVSGESVFKVARTNYIMDRLRTKSLKEAEESDYNAEDAGQIDKEMVDEDALPAEKPAEKPVDLSPSLITSGMTPKNDTPTEPGPATLTDTNDKKATKK